MIEEEYVRIKLIQKFLELVCTYSVYFKHVPKKYNELKKKN